jgi:hypothetical protein
MKTLIGFGIIVGAILVFYALILLIGVCMIFALNKLNSGYPMEYDIDNLHDMGIRGMMILALIAFFIFCSWVIGSAVL